MSPVFHCPPLVLLLAVATWVATSTAFAAPPVDERLSFEKGIRPLFARYCFDCHGGEEPEGDFALDRFTDEATAADDPEAWHKVQEMLEAEAMPPEDSPQPEEAELQLLAAWVERQLANVDCSGTQDPGRVTIRRLNRVEYDNTIRDLLGIDFHPADDFPSDDVGYGFDNIGDVLWVSPLLMEKYLAAAESITAQAIVTNLRQEPLRQAFTTSQLKFSPGVRRRGGIWLTAKDEAYADVDFPENGKYLLRARAFGEQGGDDPVRMALMLDGREVRVVNVEADKEDPEEYEATIESKAGVRRFSVEFKNDSFEPGEPNAKSDRDRYLVVTRLEVIGPEAASRDGLPESHRRIFTCTPRRRNYRECAREILTRFATRAFRRPARPEEVERLSRLVELAIRDGETFESGIALAMQAVLVSPHFLFRVELDSGGEGDVVPLDDYALASRLSYFLWSSMPDKELYARAADGTLNDDNVLAAQVRRMLADEKSQALVDNFATQWLQIRNLENITPDPKRFPQFDERLRADMRRETELYFAAIVREDRSVLELLDSDYTFLNGRLAQHYGIKGVRGEEFQRVTLAGQARLQRGGILTQASVLAVTSNPIRTSPVKRGKWIMETILGTPPPPPPPDVELLVEGAAAEESGTLRERLEQHRSDPNCAICHARMDALGFGFENYDAIGTWRKRDGKFAIDSSATLPGGQQFDGPAALKALFAADNRDFVHCLTDKMYTYALGRGLDFADQCAVDQVAETLVEHDYKFSSLVTAIVQSDLFRFRRARGSN